LAPNAKSILSFDERRCSDRRERAKLKTRLRYVFGGRLGDIPVLGPVVGIAFNTLAWSSRRRWSRFTPAAPVSWRATRPAD